MSLEEKTIPEWLRRIQIEWELSSEQISAILRIEPSVLEHWIGMTKESAAREFTGTVPPGLDSAVPFIAIYRRLAARFPKTEDQVKWLFTEHRDFGGSKPIDVAASSLENLYWVGYFLDSSPA